MPASGFLYYSTSDGSSTATSSGDAIIRVDSDGQNPTTIASGFTDLIEAMALDESGNRMFVLDNTGFVAGSATGNTIWSVDLSTGVATQIFTGTSIANSVSSVTLSPALSYDSLNGEVYFTQAGILMKMGADGSNPTAVTSSAISSAISGITLDPVNNLAFVEDATTANRDIFSVDLNTGAVTKIYQNTGFVMGTGLAYNSADGDIYFTQASATGGPPNLYKIPSNPGSTLSSATLVASNIEGSSAAQITFNQTGDEAYVRGITSGATTINQVDLATGAVSTVVSPSGQTGLSVIFAPATTPTADLSVTVDDGKTSVVPGSIDTYTITVTNNGPDTVSSLTLFDAVPAALSNAIFSPPSQGSYDPGSGLWSGLSLASGQSLSMTLSAVINASATGTISNTVTVLPVGMTDPNSANNSATDTDTVVSTATLSTTPNAATVMLGPTPVTLTDTADLEGGSNPTGSIVFTLVGPNGFQFTETDTVSGNGTYTAATVLPSSGMTAGIYQWNASYSGDANNSAASDVNNPAEQVTVTSAIPALSTTPNPATVTLGPTPVTLFDAATLENGFNPTGSIIFTLVGPNGFQFTETDTVSGNGTYTAATVLPSGVTAGIYQWNASYSGDTNNNAVSDLNNPAEQVTVTGPTLSTTPNAATVMLGPTPVTLTDTADLEGGSNPTGSIVFTLVGPNGFQFTETDTVSGNGTYTAATVLPSSGMTAGIYQWNASYSGDANNSAASDVNNPAEQVTVTSAIPTLSTTPNPATVTLGPTPVTLTDEVDVQDGFNPTGTITFTLFGPGGTTPLDTETVTVNGNGTYTTPIGFTLPGSGAATGTYQWDASYSGDPNNNAVSDVNNPNEQVTVENVPCYCAGTLILTDRGEIPVETLAIGNRVMTADGVARRIRWIGRRSYSGCFARGNHVLPICIKAGALDEHVPRRDLWISPNHAMFLHGALIEAQDLVNGVSIVQAPSIEQVDYFHIELESHDIIIAEGAFSESFVDDDSRGMFHNAHEFEALYPDERPRPDPYCAPRVAFGAQVETARRHIARRAGIPYGRPTVESRPCALVVDNQIPKSGHDGGANAILDHMRALRTCGFRVSFLALRPDDTNTHALSSLGVTPLSLPQNGAISDVIRAHAGQFDLVYLHRVESAMHCLKLARQYFDAQIIYSVADLHHVRLKAQSQLDHDHASELLQQARCVALEELAATLSADCVITHSQTEADQLQQIPSIKAEDNIRVIPWSVPVIPVRRSFAERSDLAFVGGFGHAPNLDAARWLVTDVMPLVWQEAPEIRCLLIGSGMSEKLRNELQRPGVEVLGRVANIAEIFERIRLTVAPLRFGAGLKDKVLRSIGAGLPCVGTTEAFKGMQELPSTITNECRRDTAVGLAAAIVRMHRDEAVNTSCAKTGMMYVGAFYNRSRIDELIQEVAQPAFDRYRARSRSRSECIVLNFGDTHRQPSATVATGAQPTAKHVAFR